MLFLLSFRSVGAFCFGVGLPINCFTMFYLFYGAWFASRVSLGFLSGRPGIGLGACLGLGWDVC